MPSLSPDMESAFTIAMKEAQSQCSPVLGTPHLFIGLTKVNGITAAALRAQGQSAARDAQPT